MTSQDYTLLFLFSTIFLFKTRSFVFDQRVSFIVTWLTRISFIMFIVGLLTLFELTHVPIKINILIVFLINFGLESLRTWRIISIFYKLEAPIFPKFNFKSETLAWPQTSTLGELLTFFKQNKFQFKVALSTAIERTQLALISSVFYNKQGTIRVQVIFTSAKVGKHTCNVIATSVNKDGDKMITSNINMPFGHFEKTTPLRKNYLLKTAINTIKLHITRIQKSSKQYDNLLSENTLEEINNEFNSKEQYCLETGTCQKASKANVICLSPEGSYKLWWSILSASYLGI